MKGKIEQNERKERREKARKERRNEERQMGSTIWYTVIFHIK